MNYTEQALQFDCGQKTLLGILAVPEVPRSVGVVVIVGGPQYRAGSHRQFVALSRALAKSRVPVLRFDYRGIGDSAGHHRDFMEVDADISAAITAMQREMPKVSNVVLWGLCDGASAALMYCDSTADARVTGLCLLNPWVRSAASLAKAHVKHYYADRLRQKDFWLKLLSGRVAVRAAMGFWNNLRLAFRPGTAKGADSSVLPFQSQMARGWRNFVGPILLVTSGKDYTAKEFIEYASTSPDWAGLLDLPSVVRYDIPDADHTFSDREHAGNVERRTVEWLGALA